MPEGSGSSLRGGGELEEGDEGFGEESATTKQKRLKKAEKARRKAARKAERKAEKADEKARKKAEKKVAKQRELDERVERLSGLFGWGGGPR